MEIAYGDPDDALDLAVDLQSDRNLTRVRA
jgi:hypothetical protein